ncbi:uncharacterized protein LOC106164899 [Lingula anatina]|uniref:Uncharacterized protein LOC106164899 n=1 Tax=Lingula anatina TaxID=7574 RepID=A0A1S3IJH7_LINAN|nr:uncharacterized protein LOC106164899 [Lingula anatina]|eukprot:XP_013398395.1 uncharacterized protein LOC106164899 [Lingula anatina]
MDYWNKTNLKPPPTCCIAYKKEEIPSDFDKLLDLLETALTHLSDQDALGSEIFLLGRVNYKMNCQFRYERTLQRMKQVDKCLSHFLKLNLHGCLDNVAQSFPRLEDFQSDILHVPSRQMLEYLLVRLQGAAHLMAQTLIYCQQLELNILQHLRSGFFIPNNVFFTGLVSRIWILCRSLLHHLVKWYGDLRSWVSKLKGTTTEWLPVGVSLPDNLEQLIHDIPQSLTVSGEESEESTMQTPQAPQPASWQVLGAGEDLGEPLKEGSFIKQLFLQQHGEKVYSDNIENHRGSLKTKATSALQREEGYLTLSVEGSAKLKQKRKSFGEKDTTFYDNDVTPSKRLKLKREKMSPKLAVRKDIKIDSNLEKNYHDAFKEQQGKIEPEIKEMNISTQGKLAAFKRKKKDISMLLRRLKLSKNVSDLKEIKDRALQIDWLANGVKKSLTELLDDSGTVHGQKTFGSSAEKIHSILMREISKIASKKAKLKTKQKVSTKSYVQEKITDYTSFEAFLKREGSVSLTWEASHAFLLEKLKCFFEKNRDKDNKNLIPTVQERVVEILQMGSKEAQHAVDKANQQEQIDSYLQKHVTDYPSFVTFLKSVQVDKLIPGVIRKKLKTGQKIELKRLQSVFKTHKGKKKKHVLSVVHKRIRTVLLGNGEQFEEKEHKL